MKLITTILLIVFTSLFMGCGSSQPANTKIISDKKDIINTVPKWINNPNKQNQICAIGSSKIFKTNDYEKVAYIKAKSNISKQISMYLYTASFEEMDCNSKECKKSFKRFSQHQSTNMLNNILISDKYSDNIAKKYYIRACVPKSNKRFSFSNNINQKYQTTKTSCIQQSEYTGKTLTDLKSILISQAKKDALEELYGQFIYSNTELLNGHIVKDEIKQKVMGTIRVKGNPKFYNGSNFGSICSDVTSYITKKDLERYVPKKVKLKRFCFSDKRISLDNIKTKSKYLAYKEMISKYKPSLRLTDKEAESYIQEFMVSNEKFDFNSGSYCFDAVGTILPFELDLYKSKQKKQITKYSLNIITTPKDAQVSILNIKQKYYDGIKLKKGKYDIKINKEGYKTKQGYITVDKNLTLNITLDKVVVINKDNVWLDKTTNLMWQVYIDKKRYTENNAKKYCSNLSLDGYYDWHLPVKNELKTILTKKSYINLKSNTSRTYIKNKLLNSMTMKYQDFWTSTKIYSVEAWVVDFSYGFDFTHFSSTQRFVRCVRNN